MAKTGYARERMRLTYDHVDRALDMSMSGAVEGRGVDWCDDKVPGLVLRIMRTAVTWYLKTEKSTIRLGAADVLDLDEARNQAQISKIAIRRGRDPRRQISAFETGVQDGQTAGDAAEAAALVDDTPPQTDAERLARGPWQWRDLNAAFLAHKATKLRASYFEQYASYLQHAAFDRIGNRPVSEITIRDLESVRNTIPTTSAAWRSVQQGKEMLSWAWKFHAGASGLAAVDYEWWQRWSVDYQSGTRDHLPTIAELARTLVIAERYRTLGGTEHATAPGTLAAIWAIVLTAQRTGPLVKLRRDRLFALPEQPGWLSANWLAGEMKGDKKGGKAHALPLPPAAIAALERVWSELDDRSVWCFPSKRGQKHLAQNAVNQLLSRLSGKRNDSTKGENSAPLEDLLTRYEIRPWTPHDVRRTLTTFLTDNRLGGAATAILGHSSSRGDGERERSEAVTRLHYDKSQRIGLKTEGIALWVDAVLAAYAVEDAAIPAITLPRGTKTRRAA